MTLFVSFSLVFTAAIAFFTTSTSSEATQSIFCNDSSPSVISVSESWFSYPIKAQEQRSSEEDEELEGIIAMAIQSLSVSGAMVFPQFLTQFGLNALQEKVASANNDLWRRTTYNQTVFQDFGVQSDEVTYDSYHRNDSNGNGNHTRNVNTMLCDTIYQTAAELYSIPAFLSFYSHPPLLSFLNAITTSNSYLPTGIVVSPDPVGQYYVTNHVSDVNENVHTNENKNWCYDWHLDLHPFTCIVMLTNDENSGVFEYVTDLPPPIRMFDHSVIDDNVYGFSAPEAYDDTNEYWRMVRRIIDRDERVDHVKRTIQVSPGGMYCFFGNQTLHRVTVPTDHPTNVDRVIFALSYMGEGVDYADTPTFNGHADADYAAASINI
jgi:hypothetical protein